MKIHSMLSLLSLLAFPVAVSAANSAPAEKTQQITVQQGDTLWSIAYRFRPSDRIPMAHMMQVIYARNPEAFYTQQLTSLKAGALLVIPLDVDTLLSNQPNELVSAAQQATVEPVPAALAPKKPVNITSTTTTYNTTSETQFDTAIPDNAAAEPSNFMIDGTVGLEGRYFPQTAEFAQQTNKQWSGVAQLDFYLPWNDEYDAVSFSPFYRKDSHDPQRTHLDIRELKYLHVGEDWEIHVGIDSVFWGVTETQHLVDIVNQTDWVEAPDGEDKLGQPMLHLSTLHDWGTLDFFVLPYFRERTYPWWQGRLRGPIPVNTDLALYESKDEQHHVDYAMRWNHSFSDWDLALSGFSGTSREPILIQQLDLSGNPQMVPFYPQINQLGVETLYISGSWIWKLEAIHREGELINNYQAADFGFEYTFYGVNESVIDVGWLMEYQYDSRGKLATSMAQNDLFIGTRLAFNDIDGSEILAGIAQDLDFSNSRSLLIEAKTRLNANWTANLDVWLFSSDDPQDLNYWIRQDDFIQFTLELHF
ncbi:type IV pilus assembly protein FimV [Neptunicella sp.]|uniref:type IV pilus assembly protein FimV n=1 Tax=Neptunicella sp. TaxID=2125986 RepID=UPI003F68F133